MPPRRLRLDAELVRRGLARSREHASELIGDGRVKVSGVAASKPATGVTTDVAIVVADDPDRPDFASRGGHKLAGALVAFTPGGLSVDGGRCLDAGASTGGFTDVLLSKGAARVYAVDSGTNQLAWKLRQDDRVVVLEQLSARLLTPDHIPEPIDLIVCDASFIGLAKVLDVPLGFARSGARLMALIKPQFEAGRDEVGKGGVVRDPAIHARVCAEVSDWLENAGWRVEGVVRSPITGPEGNVEFLIAAHRA